MDGNFQVVYRGYVPVWRRKATKLVGVNRLFHDSPGLHRLVGISSAVTLLAMFWPTENFYGTPLSLEWAGGTPAGMIRLATMMLTLMVLCITLWTRGCRGDSASCLFPICCLTCLANSDPFGTLHLTIFFVLVLVTLAWNWGLAMRCEDHWLVFTAMVSSLAACICFFSLGLGERTLIVATLVGANIAFYHHAPEVGEVRRGGHKRREKRDPRSMEDLISQVEFMNCSHDRQLVLDFEQVKAGGDGRSVSRFEVSDHQLWL